MPRKKKTPANRPPTVSTFKDNDQAKRWLWLGVASFVIIIAGIWFWSFELSISGFKWSNTPESKLLNENYNQLDRALNNESAQMRQEYLKTQVKKIVSQIINETNASSSTDQLQAGVADTTTSSAPATTTASSSVNKTKTLK